jgi:multidrug efflux pump subunit AcrB
MSITRLAIEKNRITTVALVVILFGGLSSYFGLPRAEDPGFVMRVALVQTFFPGASPERVELLVTDKLEKAVQQLPELDYVASESRTGASFLFVTILPRYTDMRPIWDDLRRKVEAARPDLPEGVIGPIVNDEFGDVFGTIITISGEDYSYAELKDVADDVRDELLRIPEVAKVDIYGDQEEQIFVEFNNARLAELGLSPGQLQSILGSRNIVIPGGEINTGDERIALEPSGNFETVEDLRSSVIRLPGSNQVIQLQDIATVDRGYVDPPQTLARASGTRALALAISLREGGNIIELGADVRAVYHRVQAEYPIGVDFDLVAFQPDVVEGKIDDFVGNMLQAIAVVIFVALVALGLRTGLVVSSLIPMTMLMSMLIMAILGIGLDQMSLASLIIALGMLVDNAIVMSESIQTQMGEGKGRLEAAVDSAAELRIPLLTSSLTTAAAFLPIFLAESEAGEYTAPLFKVVTITLLSSWVLSLTMIPMLAHRFLEVRRRGPTGFDTPFYQRYRRTLLWGLRHRPAALAGIVGIFVVAMMGFRFVPNIFFPPSDRALLTGDLTLPIGTPIERTEQVVRQLDRFIVDELRGDGGANGKHSVENWVSFIGEGAPRYVLTYAPEQPSSEYAYVMLNTSSRAAVDAMIPRLERFVLDEMPDVTATFKPAILGPPVNAPIEIRVSGREVDVIFDLVDELRARIGTIAGTRNVTDNWGRRTKKILVKVNGARARRAGVSNLDVAVSLQTVLSGIETTQFREDDKIIPVTMRSVSADREDLGKIEGLNIYSQVTGRSVPLRQVADLEVVWQPAKLLRRDRLRTVNVQAELEPGVTATAVMAKLQPWLDERAEALPLGYRFEVGGEVAESAKSQASINAKMPIALLIIVLLLVGQFNSIRKPVIIMLTVPLALIGVVVGLLLARSYFGFMTFLGVIALIGIVINNAIVLLDRIRIEEVEHGRAPADAILEAAQRRLRPILLTTATTVGGLLPLWLGGGAMFEPMAIAIIFGLAFATALTLGFVPILYSLFYRVSFGDYGGAQVGGVVGR